MAEIPACLTVARPPPLPLLPLPAPPWSRDSKEPPVAGRPSWGQLRQPGALESWWLSPAKQEDSALTMTGRGQVSINGLAICSISLVTLLLSPTLCGSAGRPVQLRESSSPPLDRAVSLSAPLRPLLKGFRLRAGSWGWGGLERRSGERRGGGG